MSETPAQDIKWTSPTTWGDLEVTINLTKPEKDPKAIAAAVSIPTCVLCDQNETSDGWLPTFAASAIAAQPHLRIADVDLDGELWRVQYSPYHYFNQHCIAASPVHRPMHIDAMSFARLFRLIDALPDGFFMGSNADLPIVGGSILAHDHFQGGVHEFPMDQAPLARTFVIGEFPQVQAGIVKWPLSVIRLQSPSAVELVAAADHVLHRWAGYTDLASGVITDTDGEPHNTITPIARKRGDICQLDLALRCNITSPEHPLGVFHPHTHLHHIKKENIGLIEVMGLAILPARLKGELAGVADALVAGAPVEGPHGPWAAEVAAHHPELTRENVDAILREEVAAVFAEVLECAGVLKDDAAWDRFLRQLA